MTAEKLSPSRQHTVRGEESNGAFQRQTRGQSKTDIEKGTSVGQLISPMG